MKPGKPLLLAVSAVTLIAFLVIVFSNYDCGTTISGKVWECVKH